MSEPVIAERPKHPEGVKLSDALKDDLPRQKERKGLIDKRATLIKAPDTDAAGELGAVMQPTSDQLKRINQFTRRSVSADEVVAFTTLSCNDIEDRDEDKFTTECVKDFATLEQPFSPVGKSYMVDHEYKVANAVGRIFGVDTKKISDATFLTNEVYIPNTTKNAGFIEDLEFGVNWAVSVGVVLGKDECSLPWCKAGFSSWGYWCRNGHDKGAFYTEEAEEDAWGYPLPCDSKTPSAHKCIRLFMEPRDMYELSQVFLGAQYFAALEKDPAFKTLMKSAIKGVPTIGLGREEAKKLPLRHVPDKVSEAVVRHTVKEEDDGTLSWRDENSLVWVFDPENPDDGVMSLGKSTNNEEGSDGEGQLDEDASGNVDPAVESGDAADSEGSEGDSSEGGDEPLGGVEGEVTAAADDESEEEPVEVSEEDSSTEESEEDEEAKSLIRAATQAKLPIDLVMTISEASDRPLDALLAACSKRIKTLVKTNSGLAAKAEIGNKYVEEAKASAIDWFVKAHTTGDGPVKTATFEKLLDRCGEDVELIKELTDEQRSLAQARFPKGVRRSSTQPEPEDEKRKLSIPDFGEGEDDSDERIRRIHG